MSTSNRNTWMVVMEQRDYLIGVMTDPRTWSGGTLLNANFVEQMEWRKSLKAAYTDPATYKVAKQTADHFAFTFNATRGADAKRRGITFRAVGSVIVKKEAINAERLLAELSEEEAA